MFKFVVRAETTILAHDSLRKKFAKGLYRDFPLYLKTLMINVRDYAHKYKYTMYNKAIFKGVNPTVDFSRDDYKVGGFG